MSNRKLLSKILRLQSLKITKFWFKNREQELHLAVKPYKNGCRCPTCGRRGRIVHQTTDWRRWEDIAVMGLRVLLWYAPKEIRCPTHGRVQEEIPWAPANARITYRLEWRICPLCQTMTQQAAAAILVLPTSTLSNLLHRVITRVRAGHTIRGVTTLGVDEISFCQGRTVATLVYDVDRARVLWVGRGKGRETIDRFFTECLSPGQTARMTWASCDMSPTYTGGDPGALPQRDGGHQPLPCRESPERGRGRSPQGTVAGARRDEPEGDQGAAVAAQHALPPSHHHQLAPGSRVLQRPGRQRKRSRAKRSCGPSRTSASAPASPPCCNARCAPPRLATRRAPACATCPGGCGATAWRPSTFAPPEARRCRSRRRTTARNTPVGRSGGRDSTPPWWCWASTTGARRAVAMLSSLAEAPAQLRSDGIALDIKTLRSTAYRYAARARAAQRRSGSRTRSRRRRRGGRARRRQIRAVPWSTVL